MGGKHAPYSVQLNRNSLADYTVYSSLRARRCQLAGDLIMLCKTS